jgi:hypothetical protein
MDQNDAKRLNGYVHGIDNIIDNTDITEGRKKYLGRGSNHSSRPSRLSDYTWDPAIYSDLKLLCEKYKLDTLETENEKDKILNERIITKPHFGDPFDFFHVQQPMEEYISSTRPQYTASADDFPSLQSVFSRGGRSSGGITISPNNVDLHTFETGRSSGNKEHRASMPTAELQEEAQEERGQDEIKYQPEIRDQSKETRDQVEMLDRGNMPPDQEKMEDRRKTRGMRYQLEDDTLKDDQFESKMGDTMEIRHIEQPHANMEMHNTRHTNHEISTEELTRMVAASDRLIPTQMKIREILYNIEMTVKSEISKGQYIYYPVLVPYGPLPPNIIPGNCNVTDIHYMDDYVLVDHPEGGYVYCKVRVHSTVSRYPNIVMGHNPNLAHQKNYYVDMIPIYHSTEGRFFVQVMKLTNSYQTGIRQIIMTNEFFIHGYLRDFIPMLDDTLRCIVHMPAMVYHGGPFFIPLIIIGSTHPDPTAQHEIILIHNPVNRLNVYVHAMVAPHKGHIRTFIPGHRQIPKYTPVNMSIFCFYDGKFHIEPVMRLIK